MGHRPRHACRLPVMQREPHVREPA
jgi:hypothetical protein